MARIVKTLILTLLLFIVTSGAIGFASADDGGPDDIRPRPGDRATYAATEFYVGEERPGSVAPRQIEMEWQQPEWVMDAQFDLVYAHILTIEYTFNFGRGDTTLQRLAAYDAHDGSPIYDSGYGEFLITQTDSGILGTGLMRQATDATYRTHWYEGPHGPCGARVGLHDGAAWKDDQLIVGHCDYLDGVTPFTYTYDGADRVEGEKIHRYSAPGLPHFRAAYSPNHPFPVEWTSTLSDVIERSTVQGRMYEMTLMSVERGVDSYPLLPETAREATLGPTPVVPADQVAETFGAVDATISFRDAVAAMNADADSLADFLAAHPDAYPAWVAYEDSESRDGTLYGQWYIAFTDGGATYSKRVSDEPIGSPVLPLPVIGRTTTVADWNVPYDLPSWQQIQRTAPDISAIAERYRHFSNGDERVNIGIARHYCPEDCDQLVRSQFWAGHVDNAANTGLESFDAQSYAARIIGARSDGTAAIFYRWDETYQASVPIVGAGSEEREDGTVLAGTWSFPPAPAAAGLGFLAVLGGALYHFFPAIKSFIGGVFGFSRIERSALLNHPARARIVSLVEARPGIHFHALRRELDLAKGTLSHHLRKLEADDLIRSRKAGGRLCFFTPDIGREEAAVAATVAGKGTAQVYDLLQRRPGITAQDIAAELGMAPSTVSYHRKKLRAAGVL